MPYTETQITPQHPIGSGFAAETTAAEVIRGLDLSGKRRVVKNPADASSANPAPNHSPYPAAPCPYPNRSSLACAMPAALASAMFNRSDRPEAVELGLESQSG